MSEFELIQHYFTGRQPAHAAVTLGIGDDCAVLTPRAGTQLAISTDMLVAGRHFFADADARLLGHKSLAVNLSDLAAMGAQPRAFTLALALPEIVPDWLEGFSTGLFALANQFDCQLIGGDTTKGPLTVCITVFGELLDGQGFRRAAARVEDDIWISGTIGDARLALAGYLRQQNLAVPVLNAAATRLHQPSPRVALGLALRGIAHAAIDISDGLAGDLGHVLTRSRLGATLWCDALPFGAALLTQAQELRRDYALNGGDDYELCFTAPQSRRADVLNAAQASATRVTRVGVIEAVPGLRLLDASDCQLDLPIHSFDHFKS